MIREGLRAPFTARNHTIGKRITQIIERKHLTLRTRIKRLTRRPCSQARPRLRAPRYFIFKINVLRKSPTHPLVSWSEL
ncbi:MAG TPA: hypothetical protein DIW77_21840 [Chromatiaceae bacterium]|nr:hypothetical protein [Chromatiaceae bacterium]